VFRVAGLKQVKATPTAPVDTQYTKSVFERYGAAVQFVDFNTLATPRYCLARGQPALLMASLL
jgi:hypothetical protein